MNIKIQYDGEYPNLCSGQLIVIIDNKKWIFPSYCMVSGGNVFIEDDGQEIVETGRWQINQWPKNFPEKYKKIVLEKINSEIPWGCCGGCI